MKTTLLFLALLCGAAAQIEQPSSGTVTATSSGIWIQTSAPSAKVTLAAHYDILWFSHQDAGKLMSINGLPEMIAMPDDNHRFAITSELKRPEKPEEVKIELWTKDGKKWQAEWRQVK